MFDGQHCQEVAVSKIGFHIDGNAVIIGAKLRGSVMQIRVLLAGCLLLASVASADAEDLTQIDSDFSFGTTVERLEVAITEAGLNIAAKINHGSAAEANGLELGPTILLVFGNPNVGTPLMQQERQIAYDLPLKILVWQDEQGVHLGYRMPVDFPSVSSELESNPRLAGMANALARLARAAATNSVE